MRVDMVGMEPVRIRPGGLNRYFDDLLAALDSKGDVEVSHYRWPEGEGASTSSLASRMMFYFRAGHRANGDVIDIHFALYGLAFLLGRYCARSQRGCLIVQHFHGPWSGESAIAGSSSIFSRVAKFFVEFLVYTRADLCIVLSNEFGELLSRRYRVSPRTIVQIPPGVSVLPSTRGATSADGGRGSAPTFRVCAVRRLDRRMGLDVLIRAIAMLDERFVLHIAGTGKEHNNLVALSNDLGIAQRVNLLGRISDEALSELYSSSDVSVVPTIALEGFGLVVLESMSHGTPVVASAVGGLKEILTDFDESLLVAPGMPSALAARIASACIDRRLPSRQSCIAFAAKYNWGNVAGSHLAAYRVGLSGRRRSEVPH